MGRVVEPLRMMGAQIWGRDDGAFAPLTVRGADLTGFTYEMPVASAQLKSALLIAGVSTPPATTIVIEPAPSRDHTGAHDVRHGREHPQRGRPNRNRTI